MRLSAVILAIFNVTGYCYGQSIIPFYDVSEIDKGQVGTLIRNFGVSKSLPEDYELQALLALSYYPELKSVKIKFKLRKGGAPFVSRPTVWSTFFRAPLKRTYLVIIRTKKHPMFEPILMRSMPVNAQVGALGHELAHTANYIDRGFGKMMRVIFGNLSAKYMDKFEFETDRRAISHGLGFQILAWSEHASKTLRVNEPAGEKTNTKIEGIIQRERYMRPGTIKKEMKILDQYKDFQ